MMLNRLLRRDNKGIGAVEFALIAPVMISFVVGISQMGKLFFANADMKNAMAHGARVASVWPVPDDSTIEAAVNARLARTGAVAKADVDIDRGQANGNDFVDIEMTYEVPLEFIFFSVGPVELTDTRRVFVQMNGVMPPASGSTSSSSTTGGTTSTTSSGTTSSTSATSAGGTTSSTSATSAGGTSATSASSTSASTTSSTTSSSGNGNGNSNGNSSHGHGNCKNKC